MIFFKFFIFILNLFNNNSTCFFQDRKTFPGQGAISSKHILADVWVVRASELGLTDNNIHTRTHLGHLLKPGDSVLAYEFF